MVFVIGVSFILMGIIMQLFPPKKINNYYGYRSDLAKSSQQAWDLAQAQNIKANFSYGFRMMAIGTITGYLLILQKGIYIVLGIEFFVLVPIFTFAKNGAVEKYLEAQLNKRHR